MYRYAELVHWMNNQDNMKILPAQVDIDLTNVCNQDCYYCNSADFRAEKPVQKKYTEYIALLDKLSSWRAHTPNSYGTTHTITYPGGGEPTVLVNYEQVIEHTIDLGFLTSITTNGSNLDRLLDTVHVDKALINPLNDTPEAMNDLFKLVAELGGRMLYFRPVIIDNQAYPITEETIARLEKCSQEYQLPYWANQNKTLPRNYKKCHQMFHFPVFCADGKIYICCEGKGNPQFELTNWDSGDFRDQWLNQRHYDIYNKTRVEFCAPCRPNISNINIQNILNNPKQIETLYL